MTMAFTLTGKCIKAHKGTYRSGDREGQLYYSVRVLDEDAGETYDIWPAPAAIVPAPQDVEQLVGQQLTVKVSPRVREGRLNLQIVGQVLVGDMGVVGRPGAQPLHKVG